MISAYTNLELSLNLDWFENYRTDFRKQKEEETFVVNDFNELGIYNWKFSFKMIDIVSSSVELEFKLSFMKYVKKDYNPELEPIIG